VRLISRNDASLVVGLIAGTVVIFQRPLRVVWETALDVQQQYHVDLLPALTIFAGVFIFHEARKRQQAKADARAAAAEAAQARIGAATALIAIAVRNVQLFLETREHSLRDSLTNCFNRGHGLETLDGELRRARRSRLPLSILMFDIDRFKTINDELGHLRGDDLLRAVGAQLTRVLRSTDVRCRYGGDEFLIILPDTPLIGAQQVAESLRREMATLTMVGGGKTLAVTVSVGVAAAAPADLGVTSLIERADDDRAGRRRLVSGQAGGQGSLQRRRRSRGVGHSVGASRGRPAGGRRPPAMSAW
jgi:diguanylate cyclase (GGDEF)-like protein